VRIGCRQRRLLGSSLALAAAVVVSATVAGAVSADDGTPPVNVTRPALSGQALDGQVLTVSNGTWTGTAPITYAYQWYRCDPSWNCSGIAGATANTYTLTSADVGSLVYAVVTASNTAGQASIRTYASHTIVGVPPSSVGVPVVSGWPLSAGVVLAGTTGSWSGSAPISYTFRWKRCDAGGVNCALIVAGSASSYRLTAADVGSTIMLTVVAANAQGSAWANSVPTARIAPASPAASQVLIGVHSDGIWSNGGPAFVTKVVNADAQVLHAKVSRNSLLWHAIEPQQGIRNWSRTDDGVTKLLAAGIKPEFTVYGSPSWANGVPTTTDHYYLYVPQDPAAFQRWVNLYASFLTLAATRYAGKVNLWECGNEENESYLWKPTPNVNQYVTWYKACRNAILAGNPQAKVAVGGLAGVIIGGGTPNISGRSFLQQMIAAGAPIDHVAIHPYGSSQQSPAVHIPWQGNFDDIAQIRDFLDANGRQNVDIWVTEWGWSTPAISPQTQADYVAKSLQMLRSHFPYVTIATYFCDYDRDNYTQGLLDTNLNPKPAATQFATYAQ
jgi:hypothetical protein